MAIVGGGLSGLAAAVQIHLRKPDWSIQVYERSHRVGGVIQTTNEGPFVIDHGADMFATKPAGVLELVEKLGATDRLIEPKVEGRGAMLLHRGRLVDIPEGFVLMRATRYLPMLTTPLLSPLGKLRLMAEPMIWRRDEDSDESVGDFVRRRLGGEVLDRLVGPLVAGIYTADVDRLSMQATMGPIRQMERKHGSLARATLRRKREGLDSTERNTAGARYGQFRAFRGGMQELIDRLAAALPSGAIQLNTAVETLTRASHDSPKRWQLTTVDGQSTSYDDVVVTIPAKPAAKLLRGVAHEAATELEQIETASTAIVVLVVKRQDIARPAGAFGFVVPPKEGRQILAGSFASEKFAGRAPEDHVIIRVFIGGVLQPELLEHDDDGLVRIATEELADLIGLGGDPVINKVVRWNDAMPQYHVGHLHRVERIGNDVRRHPGLWLHSASLDGVGIAPIISGAARLAEQFTQPGDAS
ncbi:MAG: protoporphyrinogen oxidase [Planctomycetota bacterium]